jgi:DNA-binding response OmpR family regulator
MSGPRRILVTDDEEYLIELLDVNLRPAGFEVLKAYDGEEGLNKAITERPDLMILDVRMPGMDGYEVCRRLKANDTTKDIPILMLSAYVQEADIKKGLSVGAVAYLKKPFNVQDLIRAVKQILGMP